MNIHATCIDYKNYGILIMGASGSGKSDLGLRLIMDKGAELVADDYVTIKEYNGKIIAECPKNIEGIMEVRGLGLCNFIPKAQTTITLVIDLCSQDKIDRMPEDEYYDLCGVKLPKIKIYPHEASSTNKVILACNKLSNS